MKRIMLGLAALGSVGVFGLWYCGGDVDSAPTTTTAAEQSPIVVEAPASTLPAAPIEQAVATTDAGSPKEPAPPPLLPTPTLGTPAPPCTSCPLESPVPPAR